jgi:3-oxoacyl-[acyl-carrier-protein] synthase-3
MNRPVYITRMSAVLPNPPVGNDQMERILGQVGPKPSRARALVLRSNGIKSRHYAIDPVTGKRTHNNAQLTAEAVRKLMYDGYSLNDMTLLVTGTTAPDQIAPNHAVMVHGELGSPPCETLAASGICVSGVNAMKFAWLSVGAGEHDSAVVAASEVSSLAMAARNFQAENDARIAALEANPSLAFEKDFLRWMLSDGAAAALLRDRPNPAGLSLRIEGIDQFSYANRYPPCMYAGGELDESGRLKGFREFDTLREVVEKSVLALKQDTRLLDKGIVESGRDACLAMLRRRQLKVEDIDWFLPHYSSEYFRDRSYAALPENFKIPKERWFTNLTRVGNVGSASIFLMLEELMRSDHLRAGQRVLCYIPESGRFSAAFIHLIATAG